jgi:hypothetical protein
LTPAESVASGRPTVHKDPGFHYIERCDAEVGSANSDARALELHQPAGAVWSQSGRTDPVGIMTVGVWNGTPG